MVTGFAISVSGEREREKLSRCNDAAIAVLCLERLRTQLMKYDIKEYSHGNQITMPFRAGCYCCCPSCNCFDNVFISHYDVAMCEQMLFERRHEGAHSIETDATDVRLQRANRKSVCAAGKETTGEKRLEWEIGFFLLFFSHSCGVINFWDARTTALCGSGICHSVFSTKYSCYHAHVDITRICFACLESHDNQAGDGI